MKKILFGTIIFMLSSLILATNTKAYSEFYCLYYSVESYDQVIIANSDHENKNSWAVMWRDNPQSEFGPVHSEDISAGTFKTVFVSDSYYNYIHYNQVDEHMKENSYDTFFCPKYAYINTTAGDEVCFSERANACGNSNKFDGKALTLYFDDYEKNNTPLDNPFKKYGLRSNFLIITEDAVNIINNITDEEIRRTLNDKSTSSDEAADTLDKMVKKRLETELKSVFYKDNYPKFVENFVNNIEKYNVGIDISAIWNDRLNTYQKRLEESVATAQKALQSVKQSGNKNGIEAAQNNLEEHENRLKKFEEMKVALVYQYQSKGKKNGAETANLKGCKALLGGEGSPVLELVNTILKFVRYAGPILMAAFTIIDLIKTAVSGEKDELKKVFQRFLKRFIAAVLLFFLKDIVNLIMGLFEIGGADCNIN